MDFCCCCPRGRSKYRMHTLLLATQNIYYALSSALFFFLSFVAWHTKSIFFLVEYWIWLSFVVWHKLRIPGKISYLQCNPCVEPIEKKRETVENRYRCSKKCFLLCSLYDMLSETPRAYTYDSKGLIPRFCWYHMGLTHTLTHAHICRRKQIRNSNCLGRGSRGTLNPFSVVAQK